LIDTVKKEKEREEMNDEPIQPVVPIEPIQPQQPYMPAQPAKSRKWYEIWWDIWTRPGMESFQSLLSEPRHDSTRGFIWIAVTSFVMALISALFSTLVLKNLVTDAFGGELYKGIGDFTLASLCGLILSPVGATIGLAVSAAIYHWVAGIFRGHGTWNNMVISLSAVSAPASIVGGVIGLISLLLINNPLLIFLPSLVAFVFAIYVIILNVFAVRVVEDIGTLEAIGTLFIPTIIVVIVITCCSLTILVPALTTIFQFQ
jgi:hypothetical protein